MSPENKLDNFSQYHLPLEFTSSFRLEDYIVSSSNESIFSRINQEAKWQKPSATIIVGPKGSGKSHLASIWAERKRANVIDVTSASGVERIASILTQARSINYNGGDDLNDAASQNLNIVIENIDLSEIPESMMFELFNFSISGEVSLLATSRVNVGKWQFELPDLLSRCKLTPTYHLEMPDDELLNALLIKQFSDRQLVISPRCIFFLVTRIERSFALAIEAVDKIDRYCLNEKTQVSTHSIARAMGW